VTAVTVTLVALVVHAMGAAESASYLSRTLREGKIIGNLLCLLL